MTTTIKLSDETKAELETENRNGESFDDTVRRLLGIERGQMWTEQEIRDLARDEMEQAVRSGGLR